MPRYTTFQAGNSRMETGKAWATGFSSGASAPRSRFLTEREPGEEDRGGDWASPPMASTTSPDGNNHPKRMGGASGKETVIRGLWVSSGCHDKRHRVGGFNDTHLFSHGSGGQKSEIGVPARGVLGESPLPVCRWPSAPYTTCLLLEQRDGVSFLEPLPGKARLLEGPHPCDLIASQSPPPNAVTFEVGFQCVNFGRT